MAERKLSLAAPTTPSGSLAFQLSEEFDRCVYVSVLFQVVKWTAKKVIDEPFPS